MCHYLNSPNITSRSSSDYCHQPNHRVGVVTQNLSGSTARQSHHHWDSAVWGAETMHSQMFPKVVTSRCEAVWQPVLYVSCILYYLNVTYRFQPEAVQVESPLLLVERDQPASAALVPLVLPHRLNFILEHGCKLSPCTQKQHHSCGCSGSVR